MAFILLGTLFMLQAGSVFGVVILLQNKPDFLHARLKLLHSTVDEK